MLEEIEFHPNRFSLPDEPTARPELPDPETTVELGRQLAEAIEQAGFVGLVGQLGSGKTTLVGGMAESLGASTPATSPTYTLVNVYETDPPIYHIDLYRLKTVDDLETTGYWDYLNADRGIVVVEWLDRVPSAWPGKGIIVQLEHRSDGRAARVWASDSYRRDVESVSESLGA